MSVGIVSGGIITANGAFVYQMPQGRLLHSIVVAGGFGGSFAQAAVNASFDGVNWGLLTTITRTGQHAFVFPNGAAVNFLQFVITGVTATASLLIQVE